VQPTSLRSDDAAAKAPATSQTPLPAREKAAEKAVAAPVPAPTGPLPTIRQTRSLLRDEGLNGTLTHDFTSEAGRPPAQWTTPVATQQSWVRRLWPLGRTNETPAVAPVAATDDGSVLGTVVFPEAPPRP
jgi:hypothetical protein